MPLYDFECTNTECKEIFEEVVRLDEDKEIKCPICGFVSKKVITNPRHYRHLSWSAWRISDG